MNWLRRLNRLISGTNSRTDPAWEQRESTRITVRSIEVTVETEESVRYQTEAKTGEFPLYQAGNPSSRYGAPSDQQPGSFGKSDQPPGESAPIDQRSHQGAWKIVNVKGSDSGG